MEKTWNPKTVQEALTQANIEYKIDEPLSQFTSYKTGGPGDIVILANTVEIIKQVYDISRRHTTPFTTIGGGSNILISDTGIRGIVLINKAKNIEVVSAHGDLAQAHELGAELSADEGNQFSIWVEPRHGEVGDDFYSFEDLDYEESGLRANVKFDSGVIVSYGIAWGLKNGMTGLQWFSGIPGTMGGALYNNIHGGSRHFSDNFVAATILDNSGIREVKRDYFDFGYDQSTLRNSKDVVVLDVTLSLYTQSDVEKAKHVAQEWARRKRLQPRVSSGCIFQNMSKEDQIRLSLPSPSIGYLIDKELGWAGKTCGGAMISDKHAAFIENADGACAADVLSLLKDIKQEVKSRYKIELQPEINLLGFSTLELEGVYG